MLSLALLVAVVATQPADPLAAANKAFAERDWPRAAELYRAVVQAHPEQASSWARLGRSLREAGRAREALGALQKAEQLGFYPPLMQYQRALAHAHLGEKDAALALLRPLVEQQFGPPQGLPAVDADPAVAGDARFKELAAKFAALAAPCAQPGSPWRQLDFWVGTWDVYDRSGNRVGQSRIERTLGDCVVLENWKGTSEGTSWNTWNAARKRWEQSWVDSTATPIFFTGELEKGVMVYHSDQPQPDGKPYQRRLTFTPLPGPRVRQFSQGTTDGGKTWSTEYDLIYVPQGVPFSAL
jgi:tetratricopeptide (TPR) repeat protein